MPEEKRGHQARVIFDEAAEIASKQDREAFLDRACAGDQDLRRQVDTLLRALDAAGGFLEAPAAYSPETAGSDATTPGSNSAPSCDAPTSTGIAAVDSTDASDPQQALGAPSMRSMREGPGSLIGPFKLLQRIGEGGMGAVYLAEQERPVRRRVALKVIKPGMDTEQVVARFAAERQALAIMDHTAEAVASWRRAIASDENIRTTSDETLYALAGCHARLGGIAGAPGSNLSSAEGAAEVDKAMAVLQRAVAAGYRNAVWIKRDPDLDPLRSRPDFQRLMMDVEFPHEPFTTD